MTFEDKLLLENNPRPDELETATTLEEPQNSTLPNFTERDFQDVLAKAGELPGTTTEGGLLDHFQSTPAVDPGIIKTLPENWAGRDIDPRMVEIIPDDWAGRDIDPGMVKIIPDDGTSRDIDPGFYLPDDDYKFKILPDGISIGDGPISIEDLSPEMQDLIRKHFGIKVSPELPPAKDAPIGEVRKDVDGNYWQKTDDGWKSYNNPELGLSSESGYRGTTWHDGLIDDKTVEIVKIPEPAKEALEPAKDAPIGQVRKDVDGNYWQKTDNGWTSYNNPELGLTSESGYRGTTWHDGLIDDKTVEIVKIPEPAKEALEPAKDAPIGQIRKDVDGNYWQKTDNGWTSYNNPELGLTSGIGYRGTTWGNSLIDEKTVEIIPPLESKVTPELEVDPYDCDHEPEKAAKMDYGEKPEPPSPEHLPESEYRAVIRMYAAELSEYVIAGYADFILKGKEVPQHYTDAMKELLQISEKYGADLGVDVPETQRSLGFALLREGLSREQAVDAVNKVMAPYQIGGFEPLAPEDLAHKP